MTTAASKRAKTPGDVWAIARCGSDRGEDDVVAEMPSILLETGREQRIPKSKHVREDSPTISNYGAGDPRGGVMKRPAATLSYAVNGFKNAIRREHEDRHQFVSVRNRFLEQVPRSANRPREALRCWPAAVRRAKLHSFSEPPSLEIWRQTMRNALAEVFFFY